jgi:hypothetical protein
MLNSEPSQQNILPSFWARRKIDDLMSADWSGLQSRNMKPELQKEITQLGLDYRLMTQFTSFVAVEDRVITKDGKPQTIQVPVEIPEGVDYEHAVGEPVMVSAQLYSLNSVVQHKIPSSAYSGVVGAGAQGSVMASRAAIPQPAPPPPPTAGNNSKRWLENEEPSSSGVSDKPTGERAILESKLHPELIKALDCWQKSGDQCTMLQNGRLQIQIFLAAPSADVLAQLKVLGFEGTTKNSSVKVLVGNLPVEKLSAIVKIAGVQFVAPAKI